MSKIKISVIVPIFNSESYLTRCLESIVNQSYSSLEIILINDGSNDSSATIIESYADKDNRIIFKHKENGGIGSAYNKALPMVTGDYVSFVDSDDYLDLNAYEELVNIIEEENPDFIHFGIRTLSETNELIKLHKSLDRVVEDTQEIFNIQLNELKHPSLARLFKKELFDNAVIFDQNIAIDEMLTPQLLLNAKKAVFTSTPYYNIVARDDSVCRAGYNEKSIRETIRVFQFLLKHAEEYNPLYINNFGFKYLQALYSIFMDLKKENSTNMKIDKELYLQMLKEYRLIFPKVRSTGLYKELNYKSRLLHNLLYLFPGVFAKV